MRKVKQITAVFKVFCLSMLGICVFFGPAWALGQKAQKDASAYVHNLNQIPLTHETKQARKISKIYAKCGSQPTLVAAEATGIIISEEGKIYGYEGPYNLQYIELKHLKPLKEDKAATDKIFAYAKEIELEKIVFNAYEKEADYCSVEYFLDGKPYSTRWAKHPYLREFNPPPKELFIIFNAVQNAAMGKEFSLTEDSTDTTNQPN